MYRIKKTIEISAAHSLSLPYESPCKNLHGHNWKIKVYLSSEVLTEYGMIVDFSDIKQAVKEKYDHKNLDDFIGQSTAERLAREIMCDIDNLLESKNPSAKCYMVEIEECDGSLASYGQTLKFRPASK